MRDDPAGFYARLGVDPAAAPEAVTAAFRRKARRLHPDVAETGNAEAFMRVKEAYDVLGDADRRAAYDRSARSAKLPIQAAGPTPAPRQPRFFDVPMALFIGLGVLSGIVAIMAVVQLRQPPWHARHKMIRPLSGVAQTARAPAPLPHVRPAGGAATHYVLPATGAAVIWQRDATRDAYLPIGQLVDFSPVEALSLVPDAGLVEIRLADGSSGFVDAARLAPGDSVSAHRAYCAYNAGPTPLNGEVLSRRGVGGGQLQISNRGEEPAVVKLRDDTGGTAAAVFVGPGASTVVANLPDGRYRPEFAVGELWSRACQNFAAGMRTQRFAEYAPLSGMPSLVIPSDLSASPTTIDIPDAAFERK